MAVAGSLASLTCPDANLRLFAHVSHDPQVLVDKAFSVQQLVEQGASCSEAAYDAPLVLGARAFARAHFDNMGKVPSPARNVRRAFSLTPKAWEDTSEGADAQLDFSVDEGTQAAPRRSACHRSMSRRKYSVAAKRGPSLGQKSLGRRHRSMSRRRMEEVEDKSAEYETMIHDQLARLTSKASALDSAQARLAQLEAQTSLGLSRLSELECKSACAFKEQENLAMCVTAAASADDAGHQRQEVEQRLEELERAHQELNRAKETVSAEVVVLKAQASEVASGSSVVTETRLEGLSQIVAKQSAQMMTLSAQLEKPAMESAASAARDMEFVRRMEELEISQQELKGSKDAVAAELRFLQVQGSETTQRTGELTETHGKVESLERIMADQASQILALSSKLADELTLGKDAQRALKDRAGNLVMRAESLRDELALGRLTNVCGAFYSERAALELTALPETRDASSLAFLRDLARRFPLLAGSAAANGVVCHHSHFIGEDVQKLKLSEGTWWEAVD